MNEQSHLRCGWESELGVLVTSDRALVIRSLENFVQDASASQKTAWKDEVKILQSAGGAALAADTNATVYHSILEYQLPLESRRPDVVLLENGNVLVIEFKGKELPTAADIDQVSAYARDLRNYHRDCADRQVHALLIPSRFIGNTQQVAGTYIVNPKDLNTLINTLSKPAYPPIDSKSFLSQEAYSPLPSLVKAARELFESKTIRKVWRANASTDPSIKLITEITHEAARTKTRRLILLTGSPGSGKTLVGLRAVHAGFLDDLSIERKTGKPTAPAVFLSGNGPLVEVLQYELKRAEGGRTFVRGVKNYVEAYSRRPDAIPPEHFLVFDEAQRAWDAQQVGEKHGHTDAKSEPDHFIEFAGRIPEWCVVLGLIGTGQEINKGEEGGVIQWVKAVENSTKSEEWTIHASTQLEDLFTKTKATHSTHEALRLTEEVRFHLVTKIHDFVDGLLKNVSIQEISKIIAELKASYPIYITRDLEQAKDYVKNRYEENKDARFGMLASSRDKILRNFGVRNEFQDSKNMKIGPWFSEGEENEHSCRHLTKTATEYQAQGLELDFSIVCWGGDLIRKAGAWTNENATNYRRGSHVIDPMQLRINSYRVLLTRGRDGMIIFVPKLTLLDETYENLKQIGIKELI
ncbi:MAG: DNA/RNA helicase domain-containing protein [Elusimicrobiota bacterium]